MTGRADIAKHSPPRRRGLRPGNATAAAAVAAVALALGACTYRAGADNPVARNLTWFSYAGAHDIRAACRPGAADRFRLIYNGDYDEQVRSYDVVALAADDGPKGGAGAMVEVRVRGPADLSRGLALADPFGPWRAEGRLVRITAGEMAGLGRALRDSGLLRPAPDRLRLDSNEFYWLASACLDGRFTVNAWKYPSPRFAALSFPAVVLRHDATEIDVNPPRPANQYPEQAFERFVDDGFEFQIRGNRLLGGGAAFGD